MSLTQLQQAEKRLFDLVAATLSLVALAPLFALIALRIRWEGPRPILFRQTRCGFNQEPFRIFKFRTMTTTEDGATVEAATRSDSRVSRVGAFLRRFSIDELPQFLNVLTGEMSIVGPCPHALVHDQRYAERISRYARRHNVKPGITRWAQVNGHRGEIHNDEDMQARAIALSMTLENPAPSEIADLGPHRSWGSSSSWFAPSAKRSFARAGPACPKAQAVGRSRAAPPQTSPDRALLLRERPILQQPTFTPPYDPKTTPRHLPNLPPPSTTCSGAI